MMRTTSKAKEVEGFLGDQLIHVKGGGGGGVNEEFSHPQKQGVNLWAKISTQLAATYLNFDKDSESCRKKFQAVLSQYRVNKAHNDVSGNDRRHTCKWYDVVNEYYHDRATSIPFSLASSTPQDDVNLAGLGEMDGESNKEATKPTAPVKRSTPKPDKSLATMVDIGQQLLEYLKDNSTPEDALERERLTLMAGLHASLQGYLKYADSRDP
ncbi:hypothetical protein L7F22_002638 [Adiantum nelumboides]|nr:hypothetical protein [Adiantum nelumboides]